MDKRCLKSSIDFLFPRNGFAGNVKCVPKLLVKSSFPSKIKPEKIKLLSEVDVELDKEYSFICSLVETEDWLSNKMIIANVIFDEAGFPSCRNALSKLPTKESHYVGKSKKEATTILMTPARILTNKNYDILDFQSQNSKRRLKDDDYYAIIYEWIKKKT